MNAMSFRSLGGSLFIHAAVAGLIALVLGFQAPRISPPPANPFTIFPTADTSSSLPAASPTAPASTPRPISVSIPVTPPAARPEPTPPIAVINPPTAKRPAPARSPRRLTIDEFRSLHGSPENSTRPKPTTPPAPRVSETFPTSRTSTVAQTRSENISAATHADALRFTPGLLRDLRAAFVNAGIAETGLSAVVEFTFDENGVMGAARIVRPSGNRTFDDAVLAAFTQTRVRDFPRDAAGQSYTVTFQNTGR